MMDTISCFSVRNSQGYIVATIPGDKMEALARLQNDDPIWGNETVRLHWEHKLPYGRISRRTPLSRHIKFIPSAEEEEARRNWDKALTRLREVWRLRQAGKTYKQIGEVFGVAPGQARKLYLKADIRMRAWGII